MGNLAKTIPFTELWERLLTMSRIDSPNNEDYAKGLVNDVYVRTLPRIDDWNPLVKDSWIATTARYNTGTVAVNAGSTAITGTSTVWTAAMIATDGYKIKLAGNDNVYDFTYASATTGTISPALSGSTNLTSASYVIFRDEYQLASDFDRLLKNGSVYYYSGGRVSNIIDESPRDKWREDFTPDAMDPIWRVMLTRTHATTGYQLIRVNPPPKTALVYPYEYIQQVTPMTDYNTGRVAVTNGSATVTGTDTSWSSSYVGAYFRVDSNGAGDSSKWYQISSVDSTTQITLTSNWEEDTEGALEYHLSKAPTAFPAPFHEFILYEAILLVVGEQGDPLAQNFVLQRDRIMYDLKKNYKSRRTNVQVSVEDDGVRSWR